jgi:hypothetical protein
MKKYLATLIFLAICCQQTSSQSPPPNDLPRYEVGAEFASLSLTASRSESQTHLGAGGRFTVNWNPHVAFEAAGSFFPGCSVCTAEITGHITEGFFGIKAGRRFDKIGIFGKARPGFVSFSKGFFELVPADGTGPFPFNLVVHRQTNFAADLGGVIETYPSRRIVLRFDSGAILDHYGSRTFHAFSFDPTTGAITSVTIPTPSHTRWLFQFTTGVGFRF